MGGLNVPHLMPQLIAGGRREASELGRLDCQEQEPCRAVPAGGSARRNSIHFHLRVDDFVAECAVDALAAELADSRLRLDDRGPQFRDLGFELGVALLGTQSGDRFSDDVEHDGAFLFEALIQPTGPIIGCAGLGNGFRGLALAGAFVGLAAPLRDPILRRRDQAAGEVGGWQLFDLMAPVVLALEAPDGLAGLVKDLALLVVVAGYVDHPVAPILSYPVFAASGRLLRLGRAKEAAMSRFSAAQKAGILSEARANVRALNLAEREATSSRRSEIPEIIYKTRDNAVVPGAPGRAERKESAESGSQLPWWQWVDDRLEARLEAHGESVGEALADYVGPQFAAMKRELELLQREVTQLREQIAVERGLRDLRTQVEVARAEVPKLPAIAAKLERGQAELKRELKATKDKLTQTRVNQSMTNFKLDELSKATAQRAAGLEMKIETTVASFAIGDIHPDARAALRDFAAEVVRPARSETIWRFDPGPTAGTA
jgi:hypothetical protein